MKQPIHWFEIPTADIERATRFYENVFAIRLRQETMAEIRLAVFPYEAPAIGGALCQHAMLQPGPTGPAIYLDGGDDLAAPLARVEAAGGKVLLQKTPISPEIGFMAFFEDSEGNHIGLHSMT